MNKVKEITEITVQDIISLLEPEYYMYHVGDNSFNESIEAIQQAIKDNSFDCLYNSMCLDHADGLLDALTLLHFKMRAEFGITLREAKVLVDQYQEELENTILNRDISDPIGCMIKNTSRQVMFYDTGYEVVSDSWTWDDEKVAQVREQIKSIVSLTSDVSDEDIDDMIQSTTYGGNLVIYFLENFERFITERDFKSISFRHAAIAIIDIDEGSGNHCYLSMDHKFALPFKRENIFLDKSIKYNYTFEVCGLDSKWCRSTIVELSEEPSTSGVELSLSGVQNNIEENKRFLKIFNEGGCSFSDRDITRHRDVFYTNNFPCGSKCPHCGAFWVD